ncbi:hypothetical protein CRG98_035394 [Punica granatum]|uniref:Mediator complex subunit 15 KIX domain-containing protein n=1 Tax=Punica granatum TaxID=22663 RepID=A0A2I0IJL4_PUNGR|nr:hypothetical protein CRG98_035394 [Punica granatum]
MENNNGRPAPPGGGGPGGGGEAAPEGDDWRNHLPQESRQRIVNKIMETLKRHLPFSGPEGLHELRKIAVRFEERIFHAAANRPDYLRQISLKMLTMETKSQNSVANSMPSGSAGNSSEPPDSGWSELAGPETSLIEAIGHKSLVAGGDRMLSS